MVMATLGGLGMGKSITRLILVMLVLELLGIVWVITQVGYNIEPEGNMEKALMELEGVMK